MTEDITPYLSLTVHHAVQVSTAKYSATAIIVRRDNGSLIGKEVTGEATSKTGAEKAAYTCAVRQVNKIKPPDDWEGPAGGYTW